MTLSQSRTFVYSKEYPLFCLWAIKRGVLFFPKELAEGKDLSETMDLMSKVYILMKRMNQSYDTLMRMPSEEFDFFFNTEMKLIEEEEKERKELENKNK